MKRKDLIKHLVAFKNSVLIGSLAVSYPVNF